MALDGVFRYQFFWIGRQKQRSDRDVGVPGLWKEEALRRIGYIAGFPQGKGWLETFQSRDPEIQTFVSNALANIKPKPCTELFDLFEVDN